MGEISWTSSSHFELQHRNLAGELHRSDQKLNMKVSALVGRCGDEKGGCPNCSIGVFGVAAS